MLINFSKKTLPSFRVSISYNNEEGFEAISKIIQLFRKMKINIIFEPIEIAGKNYLKNIKYGIDEGNLLHLKETNLLLHTSFDYSYFDKSSHIYAEKYLNYALQNYFIKCFLKKGTEISEHFFQTDFFTKNSKFILNLDVIKKYYKNILPLVKENIDEFLNKSCFYYSFGAKYSIFNINNFSDENLILVAIEILKYLNLNEQVSSLISLNFKNITQAIDFFSKNIPLSVVVIKSDNINFLPKIIWKNIETKFPHELMKNETKLDGIYKIDELVFAIKDKNIIIPDDYELYQILVNDIEYFPNINFFNEIVVNPVIKLKKKEINQKIW